MRVSREALEQLSAKYSEMLSMRLAHQSGGENAAMVRVRMARLASRFPGALREVDDLELGEIRRRIRMLDAVVVDEREVELWMEAIALFHSLARGALCAKRWLGGRKRVDAHLEQAFVAEVSTLPFPDDARAWANELERIASPPRGRVTDVVFARIARTLGVDDREARHLVFGVPRRERRAGGVPR
ncbi:MAG TPA: hypothetical protein VIF09_06285 [Polyangiaceae bacterium]